MVFIVSPTKRDVMKVVSLCEKEGFQWVYLGENMPEVMLIESWLSGNGIHVPLAGYLQQTARKLRQSYIGYIGKLSTDRQSLEWWAGELSEKDPTISKVFRNVCYLKICQDILQDILMTEPAGNIIFIAENYVLRKALYKHLKSTKVKDLHWHDSAGGIFTGYFIWINALLHQIFFIVRGIYYILITHWLLRQYKTKAEDYRELCLKNDLNVLNAWVDRRSFGPGGTYSDAYLGKFGPYLNKDGNKVVYVANILQTIPYRDAVRKLLETKEIFLFPFAFLKMRDLLFSAMKSLFAKPDAADYPPFESVDVADLIQDDSERFWKEGRMSYPLLRFRLVKRWKDAGIRIKSFFYPFENMRWEKMFCMAFKKYYPDTTVTAYAHSSFSMMALNHFCSNAERDIMPQPDRILTNGDSYVDIFKNAGYRTKEILCAGAVRYEYLFTLKPDRHNITDNSRKGHPVVLVTPSIDRDTAIELILKTICALKLKNEWRVIIKCHPLMPFEKLTPPLSLNMLPPHFSVSETPAGTLLEEASVLLYSDSTTALEAIVLGVPVVQVSSDYALDMDPLDVCPETRRTANSEEEIVKCIDEIIAMDPHSVSEMMIMPQARVKKMLKPVTDQVYSILKACSQN